MTEAPGDADSDGDTEAAKMGTDGDPLFEPMLDLEDDLRIEIAAPLDDNQEEAQDTETGVATDDAEAPCDTMPPVALHISANDANSMAGPTLARSISNLEVAAKNVEVELLLPPSFEMVQVYDNEYFERREEVTPQHLSSNDTMIFRQEIASCDLAAYTMESVIAVKAIYEDPITLKLKEERFESTIGTLLQGDNALVRKGDAIVAYAKTLLALKVLQGDAARRRVDETLVIVDKATEALPDDTDLIKISALLSEYKNAF